MLPSANPAGRGHAAIRSVANERKFVTVLFADLCNSTELISDADPEEAQRRLTVAIAAMSESVQEYGGTISQLLGDGLLALFGAPVAQEDHALRACLAAIALQQRMRATTVARPLQVRVGINSGEVVVGTASQYLSQHYRADGSTIHIASRESRRSPSREPSGSPRKPSAWRSRGSRCEARANTTSATLSAQKAVLACDDRATFGRGTLGQAHDAWPP